LSGNVSTISGQVTTNTTVIATQSGQISTISGSLSNTITSLSGYARLNGSTFTGNVTFSGTSYYALVPSGNFDLVNKAYVDATAAGLNVHPSVYLSSVSGNLPSYVYVNGTTDQSGGLGIGAVLSGTTAGIPTIDGTTIISGERLLIKHFTGAAAIGNGVYTVTRSGSSTPGNYWLMTRATDMNNSIAGQVGPGDLVFVSSGNTQASTSWVQVAVGSGTDGTIILGSDGLAFSQFAGPGQYQAGNGLQLTGAIFSVLTANTADITVAAGGIDLANTGTPGIYGTASTVSSITTDSKGRVTSISGVNIQITEGQVTNLTSDLSTISGQIGTISGTVAQISGSLSTVSGSLSTVSGIAYTNKSNISTLSGYVSTISGQSGTTTLNLATLSGYVSTISGQSGTNTLNVAALSGSVSTISGTLSQISGSLSTVSGTLSQISGSLSTVSGTLSQISGSLSTTSGTVSLISGWVSTISGTLSQISGSLSTVSGTVSTLSGSVSVISGTLSNVQTSQNTISGALTVVSGVAYAALPKSGGIITGNLTVSGNTTAASGITVWTDSHNSALNTLALRDTTSGNSIYLRAADPTVGGGFQIVNSGFTAPIFQITDAGKVAGLSVSGTTTLSGALNIYATSVGGTTSISGYAITYNGTQWVSAAGGGTGPGGAYATADLTAQGAALTTTTLYTTTTSGLYTLTFYGKVTRAATTSSTLGPFSVTYTDPDATVTTLTNYSTSPNSTVSGIIYGSFQFYAASGTAVQYAVPYASSGATSMQYNMHISLGGTVTSTVSSAVSSFNTRTGPVTSVASDYSAYYLSVSGGTVGPLTVSGGLTVSGTTIISGANTIYGSTNLSGTNTFNGGTFYNSPLFNTSTTYSGNVTVGSGNFTVTSGITTLSGALNIYSPTVGGVSVFSGSVMTYNGTQWVVASGGGSASTAPIATVNLTAQSGAITATTLTTTTQSGLYTINYYGKVTTAATTSSVLGGFSVISTDPDGSTVTTQGNYSNENSVISGFISGAITIYVGSGTNIQYLNGYTSVGATAMQYNLHINLAGSTTISNATTVNSFNGRSGTVVPGSSDYLAVPTGGLTGATAATRYVGGTTSGAPVSGTFVVGDYIIDQTGTIYICTVAGTPGTWVQTKAGSLSGTLAVTAGGTGLTATTVGGIPVGSSTTAFSNLTIGTNGQVLTSNGTTATWAAAGGGALTYVQSFNQGTGTTSFGSMTYTLITGMSITAGTWLINYQVSMGNATYNMNYQAIVSTSSTAASGYIGATGGGTVSGSNSTGSMSGSAVYVSGSTQIIYLHIVAGGPSSWWNAEVSPTAGIKVSGMTGIKIA